MRNVFWDRISAPCFLDANQRLCGLLNIRFTGRQDAARNISREDQDCQLSKVTQSKVLFEKHTRHEVSKHSWAAHVSRQQVSKQLANRLPLLSNRGLNFFKGQALRNAAKSAAILEDLQTDVETMPAQLCLITSFGTKLGHLLSPIRSAPSWQSHCVQAHAPQLLYALYTETRQVYNHN